MTPDCTLNELTVSALALLVTTCEGSAASGTVPLERLPALRLVKPPPLPEKEPALSVPEKIGLAGRLPSAIVPLSCAAGSIPSKLLALLAMMAYGAGVRGCNGTREV